jgi:hypothetical protein
MAHYSRSISHQSLAADEVQALLFSYPIGRQAIGITIKELLRDYPERLKSDISVIAAVDLLTEEGKVLRQKSTGHAHPYDSIRIFPQPHMELYKECGIEVRVRLQKDRTFDAYGFIRKAHPFFNGIPFERSFNTQEEKHPTADAALIAGIGRARKMIDDEWFRPVAEVTPE